jgi:hypothetical protein
MLKIGTYFYLLNKVAVRHTAIMLQLSKGSERIRISTGISTVVSDWNEKKRKSKLASVNKILRDIDAKVEAYSNECELLQREPELSVLADLIRGNTDKPIRQKMFYDYIQMYYDAHKRVKAENTIRKYLTLKAFFIKNYPDKTIYDIDSKFATNLRTESLQKKESDNTISKRFQLIRIVLKWCNELKYIANIDLKHFTHSQTDKTEQIYLTVDELTQIENIDLSANKNNEFLRDVFIVACHTGVDYCDLNQLTKSNLKRTEKGNRYFQIIRRKTEKGNIYSFPPCTDKVYYLLKKWDWNIENLKISCDKSRYHLKRLAFIAGIVENVTLKKKSGNEIIESTKPKFEWIHWKTARRTYITNHLLNGKMTELVSNAVGHKKPTTTAKYQQAKPALMVDMLIEN